MSLNLVIISDTHTKHQELDPLPDGDILVCCGDHTTGGTASTKLFLEWLRSQPHKRKILIAGNHCRGFENQRFIERIKTLGLLDGIDYLCDSGVEIGGVKFWGSPVTPRFYDWAFNRDRGPDIAKHWAMIPKDTQVLVTHGPPYGILDGIDPKCVKIGEARDIHQGCEDLRKAIDNLPLLKLHCFGHLHLNGGKFLQRDGKTFINAAVVNEQYQVVNKPQIFHINDSP